MERYRRGHNGADSKSVCVKAHKGSNPFLSAKSPLWKRFWGGFHIIRIDGGRTWIKRKYI